MARKSVISDAEIWALLCEVLEEGASEARASEASLGVGERENASSLAGPAPVADAQGAARMGLGIVTSNRPSARRARQSVPRRGR